MSTDVAAPTLAEIKALLDLFPPLRVRACPLAPTPVQEAFLRLHDKEVFFGGGAGGGKSVAMLMAALQYVDVPGYRALLLRPSQSEFTLGGGLLDLAHEWLAGTRAHWSGDTHTWRFPAPSRTGAGGATLTFGYLANHADIGRYAGSSYSFLGFDELTRFEEQLYRRMFRVLRQAGPSEALGAARDGTTIAEVPARIRATSNPGGTGHAWVKERMVDPATREPGAIYLPSTLVDNPHLDQATYLETLSHLPHAEQQRLINNDWAIPDDGELFKRDWFQLIEKHQLPDSDYSTVRAWDLAATEPSSRNRDPDWTVGILMHHHKKSGDFYIADIIRERKAPGDIQDLIKKTAEQDGRTVQILIEQEPGSSGKAIADHYKRHVLTGYRVKFEPSTGSKNDRALPAASAAQNELIKLVRGKQTQAFLDELTSFPHGSHDDCIDALSAAHNHLTRHGTSEGRISVPQGRTDLDLTRMGHAFSRNPMVGEGDAEYISRMTGIPLYRGGW